MIGAMLVEEPPVGDALLEQAARFRARLADAPRDSALRARIEAWKAQNPLHRRAYEEAEQIWAVLGPRAGAGADKRPARGWLLPMTGVAAAVAAVLLAPTFQRAVQDMRSDAVAEVGAQRAVTLADGSRVALNSDTALTFAIDGKSRNVRMLRGEAFFAVAHDPDHPFRIQAGDAVVTVLGTRFNVRMAGDEVRVTVEQGRVRLAGEHGERILTAEMQGIADPVRTRAHAAISADVTAWRRGRAVYYDAPLGDVIEELSRYRAGGIYIVNPALRERHVTGAFRTDAPQETLEALKASLKARSLALPGGAVLLY